MDNNTQLLTTTIFLEKNCNDCDNPIRADSDYIRINSNSDYACIVCAVDYEKCVNCNDSFKEYNTISNDDIYCNDCYTDCVFNCYDCNDDYSLDSDYEVVNENYICQNCLSGNYYQCYDCDTWLSSDDIYSCDSCGQNYCASHENSCGCDTNELEGDFYPLKCETKGKTIKIKRLIGIELEAENGNSDDLVNSLSDTSCGIGEDGSLNNGMEVKTPPRELADFEAIVKKATEAMTNTGYQITSNCGLHVHLDATDFKDNYTKISNVFRTFYAIEDIIFSMLPRSRQNNNYCKKLSYDYNFKTISRKLKPDMIDENWYKGEVDKNNHHNNSRYHGLNLHSIFYRGTIEFRYHSGTLNEKKILNWTNFLLHATEYALNKYKYKQIYKLYKMKTHKKKFDAMIKLFKIDKKTRDYLEYRINLNNPGFFQQLEQDSEDN